MKYFPLVWAALRRKPVRVILTILSVMVAFALLGMMIGFKSSLSHLVDTARPDRIMVNSRFGADLPEAMHDQIAHIPGVLHVASLGSLFGYYQNRRNNAFVLMVDSDMRAVWPELGLTPQQYGQLKANPTGAFYSRATAQRWKLKPGDTFPIITPTIARADGTQVWPIHVLGIVDDIPTITNGFAVGSLTYLDQARALADRYKVVQFRVIVADPKRGDAMAKLIDQNFANSGTPTRSISEKTAIENVAGGAGGIDFPFVMEAIAGAGLFMSLFLTGNSIAQSVRERIPEFAVLKTIGFSDSGVMALVVAEAAIPCLVGGFLGMALASWVAAIFPRLLPPNVGFPAPYMSASVYGIAFVCAALVALISAAPPALRIGRLDVATALSGR
jgi:putative ABC transport system permease protein